MAEGTEGLENGEADTGKASIYMPSADPLAVAPLSVAQTKAMTSPALTEKVTCE